MGQRRESTEFLMVRDAAAVLGVSDDTIMRIIRGGDLPAMKVHKRGVRIARADLDEFIARRQAAFPATG